MYIRDFGCSLKSFLLKSSVGVFLSSFLKLSLVLLSNSSTLNNPIVNSSKREEICGGVCTMEWQSHFKIGIF